MKTCYQSGLFILFTSLMVSGCTPQAEVTSVHQDVQTLSHEMRTLQKETRDVAWQNALNARSTEGAWLIPGAQTPARLTSQLGLLTFSLARTETTGNGVTVYIHVHRDGNKGLPAFNGNLVWGTLSGTLENYQQVNTHSLQFQAPATLTAPVDIDLAIHLPDTQLSDVGFIRIHGLSSSDTSMDTPDTTQ
ncbi:DUF3251 domain-containing protein [Mangrovibacter yixingensis]|uniref:DUF3251 domain-containing protein n=1 Tax=Mangrovibacter yixingensis TaxID=1529639 RepID=UPI001CFD31F2|nr:DUF3251 domain-containing protein [Mangrovibacter yixingensis]